MSGLPSKPIMVFSTQQPSFVSAKFLYNYYERDEFVNVVDITDPIKVDKPPRLVEVNFSPITSLVKTNSFGVHFNNYINQIIQQKDKITSELILQSSGYIKYTSDTDREYSFYITSDLGASANKSKIKAFFENASTSQGQQFADAPENTGIYINTTTNRPTSKSADIVSQKANETLIASDVCFDLVEASAANPFSIHSKKNHSDLKDLRNLQVRTRRRTNPSLFNVNDYVMEFDALEFNDSTIFDQYEGTSGMGIIAYILFKSQVDELGNVIEELGSFVITDLESSSISDIKVKYGARYKYNLHPLYIIKPDPNENAVFAMVGARGKSVRIQCVENVPPPPVESIQFSYKGSGAINLRWTQPIQYGNIPDRPIGDIKGYQIFIRDSFDLPFKLYKYIDFNDMVGRQNFKLQEDIPSKYIFRCSFHASDYTINVDRDRNYIIAMCAIDAHGNSSNLSPQYIVRLDSTTNALNVDFASYKGAPKQYPNMLMADKIFLDCIKVSKKNKMTVYFDPALTQINLSENSQDQVNVLPSTPLNSSLRVPSYQIQLINVTKQSDKIVNIILKNNNTTTLGPRDLQINNYNSN